MLSVAGVVRGPELEREQPHRRKLDNTMKSVFFIKADQLTIDMAFGFSLCFNGPMRAGFRISVKDFARILPGGRQRRERDS